MIVNYSIIVYFMFNLVRGPRVVQFPSYNFREKKKSQVMKEREYLHLKIVKWRSERKKKRKKERKKKRNKERNKGRKKALFRSLYTFSMVIETKVVIGWFKLQLWMRLAYWTIR